MSPRLGRRAARLAILGTTLALACSGSDRPDGAIEGKRRPQVALIAEGAAQDAALAALDARAGAPRPLPAKRILFGDLHVHTTFSIDAFFLSLPIVAGEGAHPPADLCDFARYCSQLDFYALTDHAESLTPDHWAAERESIRQCNALAGDPSDPDLVAFTGFEWTQVGATPETHFGHKCVFFKSDADAAISARPINARSDDGPNLFAGLDMAKSLRWVDPLGYRDYADFLWFTDRIGQLPHCARGTDTRTLPADCVESAATPDVLFEKLHQWGYPVMVIPHGTTWGLYTPPTTSMDKQLTRKYHDPGLQPLIEIMSGHGNSEAYRWWSEFDVGPDGRKICPAPTRDYLPCCWQAGEIMRKRCGNLSSDECTQRVEEAKRLAMDATVAPHLVFPDTRAEDWLDCGQCRDCFKPSLGYRPRESVQYTMSLSNFDEPDANGTPLRFQYGFVSSSDNHKARGGTGYKQYDRRQMTEASGVRSKFYDHLQQRQRARQADASTPMAVDEVEGLLAADVERVASYLYPGGLVAAHSAGRSRDAIWEALQRREVYGTSGPRILLWFDLLNGPEGPAPMGSSVQLAGAPRFEVRAVGSALEQPGCPETSTRGLTPERLTRLCRGECHNPGDARHPIAAIEIVRIRPQSSPGEDVNRLIEDPWLRFECAADPAGCTVQFEDLEFPKLGRDTLYYARVLQEETPAVNGANLRTAFDASGNAVSTQPCYGDYRTPLDDDCLAPVQERAWSSPIFVGPAS